MIKQKFKKKGFTVVELVIVIAIIAILAAVLIPTFIYLVDSANMSADQQAITAMNKQLAVAETLDVSDANSEVKAVSLSSVSSSSSSAETKNRTVYDAQHDIEEGGLNYNYTPLTKNCLVYWIKEYNRVVLYNSATAQAVYPKEYEGLSKGDKNTTWSALKDVEANITDGVLSSIGDASGDVIIPYGVTSIASTAFNGNLNITSVTIPGTVKTVSLQFNTCTNLESITFCEGVTKIDSFSFLDCKSLTKVSIPSSIEFIGTNSFTSSQIELYQEGNAKYLGNEDNPYVYLYSVDSSVTEFTIPDSVRIIRDDAFWGCNSLTSIVIPDNVVSTGVAVFKGCSSLKKVSIGSGLKIIQARTFADCTSLTDVTIGNNVQQIGDSAFNGCYNLMSITIPASVTTIGSSAFSNCYRLIEVYNLSDSINLSSPSTLTNGSLGRIYYYTTIYGQAEGYAYIYNSANTESRLTTTQDGLVLYETDDTVYVVNYIGTSSSVEINFSGTKEYVINPLAFYNCTSLTSVTIGNSVTKIGACAFVGCSNLSAVNLATTSWGFRYVGGVWSLASQFSTHAGIIYALTKQGTAQTGWTYGGGIDLEILPESTETD